MTDGKTLLITFLGLSAVFLLSGCLDQYGGGGYLDLELLTEDQITSFNEEYINLTFTDLSPHPTLKEAILQILDPKSNINEIFIEIPNDEMNRILTEILSTPENDTYNYIAYYEYLFQISFAVP
ncbi:MAG: hypothetical protein ACFFAE_21370 [Candidatus Hodarchaeota archaeon]